MSVMRTALLKASQSRWLRERAPRYRFMRRTVERFMPGETLDDAMRAAAELRPKRLAAVLTHLGENIADAAEAQAVTEHYLTVLDKIREQNLPAEISIKLTQLGLDLGPAICAANLRRLIERSPAGRTVWIDMEQSPYVDVTLETYRQARAAGANVGVCVQAYLTRTEKDVEALLPLGGGIRLVKGAYNEAPTVAYADKRDVDENYFRLAQKLLAKNSSGTRVRAAMATHDKNLISRINAWAGSQGLPKDALEFQMLYGIQRAEQLRLADDGYRAAVLISYGTYWFQWFMRRLAERPANAWFLARNFFAR